MRNSIVTLIVTFGCGNPPGKQKHKDSQSLHSKCFISSVSIALSRANTSGGGVRGGLFGLVGNFFEQYLRKVQLFKQPIFFIT